MKLFFSACPGLLVLAAGLVLGQPGTGSQQTPGQLPTVDVQLADLQQDVTNKQAKEQEAREKAAAKEKEARAQMEQLNRQRQANESQAAYDAWVRQQQQTLKRLENEAQAARGRAQMAEYQRKETEARLARLQRDNPGVKPAPRPAQQPGTTPPPTLPRHQFGLGKAYDDAVKAKDFQGPDFGGGTIRPGTPPVIIPGPDRPLDPLPRRPPPPQTQPIIEQRSSEKKILTNPGGVIMAATAEITGLRPAEVASASFDTTSGILTLALHSGKKITYKLDADDFTVAVRSVFDRQVDPTLSMSFDPAKPGFKAVEYTGPLFKTRFGKLMYEIDDVFGSIMFNREGGHRAGAAVIPADLVYEADITRKFGTRVYLLAQAADFAVEDDHLVCKRIDSKVQVTATDYTADYVQESLHRVARVMDENFEALVRAFPEFQEFRRLAEHIALAKWLKRHAIAFDWSELKTRRVAEHDMPAYVPANDWSRIFNGQNLDGWRLNLSSMQCESSVKDNHLSLKPTGQEPLELRASAWGKSYDICYVVQTQGPVELIIRDGLVGGKASVTIDTKGERHALEVFFREGKWSVVGPKIDERGEVTIPQPPPGGRYMPNDYGFRVRPGSTLMLFAAAMRRW